MRFYGLVVPVSLPRYALVCMFALLTSALAQPSPTVGAFPTDGVRLDLCGPTSVPAGAPAAFAGRLTASDRSPARFAPLGLGVPVELFVDGESYGGGFVDPDGWFVFAVPALPLGPHTVTVALPLGASAVASTTHAFDVNASTSPLGLSAEAFCYLAYRDGSYAQVYALVGGLLGNDTRSTIRNTVGGSVYVEASQSCWTSIPFCEPSIRPASKGFAVMVEPNEDGWDDGRRAWAAWAGPFEFWAGAVPTTPGCSPTLWVDVDAWVDVEGRLFHADAQGERSVVCDRLPTGDLLPPGPG